MKFTIILERDDDGVWVAECPSIPGCISQGDSREEAAANIREAIDSWLDARGEHGMPLKIDTRKAEAASNAVTWALMFGAFAFVGPIAVSVLALVGPFVVRLKHGIPLSEWRESIVIHGVVFSLSILALAIWLQSFRWFVLQSIALQKLLAVLCWLAVLISYGMCLVFFY